MIRRPVQWRSGGEREKSERSQEPPENRKPQSPTHGRTVAPHVTLEEQPKAGTNEHGHAKLKGHGRDWGVSLAEPGDQREKVTCRRPASKNHSTKHSCKSTDDDRAPPVERRVLRPPARAT